MRLSPEPLRLPFASLVGANGLSSTTVVCRMILELLQHFRHQLQRMAGAKSVSTSFTCAVPLSKGQTTGQHGPATCLDSKGYVISCKEGCQAHLQWMAAKCRECTQTSFLNFNFNWKIMEDPSLQNSQKKIEKVLTNTRTGSWPKPPHPLPLALVPHHRNACGQNQVPSMPRTFPVEQTFDESCLGKDTAHPIRFLDFYNPCPGLSLHQNNLAIMHRRTQPVAA